MSITYLQYSNKWKTSAKSVNGLTLATHGCGPTSIATMLANSIKKSATPSELWNYMLGKGYITSSGSTHSGINATLKAYSFDYVFYNGMSKVKEGLKVIDKIYKSESKNYFYLLFTCKAGTQGGVTWTSAGHFLCATGYKIVNKKRYLYVRDSGGRNNNGYFCYEDTLSDLMTNLWFITAHDEKQKSKVKFNVTLGTEDTSTTTTTDDSANLVLTQAISKLYSSNNYEFIADSEDTESTQSKIKKSASIQALQNLSNSFQQTESSSGTISNIAKKVTQAVSDTVVAELAQQASTNPKHKFTLTTGTLLSFDNIIEAPTIIVNLNGYIIGGYGNIGDTYPNYITSLRVQKTSGKINQYTINLSYQVRYGEDPNFIDKLLGNTGFTNKIQIIYGDSNASKIYRDDNAYITNVTFSENIASHKIDYTITALSSIINTAGNTESYVGKTAKASTLIDDLLYSKSENSQALLSSFSGMTDKTKVYSTGLIPTDDMEIKTVDRLNVSPISQLLYYVNGMCNKAKNTFYTLNFFDDTSNEYGGPYFKITEFGDADTAVQTGNYFEVDVGYPGDNFVTDFNVNMDSYYPMVYKYNNGFEEWNYDIDNYGNLTKTKANTLITNNYLNRRNVIESNWWSKVTEYPITATLTIKGLVKPVVLASYIKVNCLFYGSQDLASGIYAITAQEDSISSSGYITTLSLTRLGNSNNGIIE